MTLIHRAPVSLIRTPRLSLSAAALLLGVSLSLGGRAMSQSLPPEVSSAAELSSDQKERVKEFANANLAKLKGSDPHAREAARDELMAPLDAQGVTIAFRLTYASSMDSELGRIATSTDDHTAFNALRVAGKLGTPKGLDILRGALSDKRPPVRAGAARTIRESIRAALTASQSLINQSKLEEAVDKLASALASENDAIVAKELVLALDAPRAGTPNGPQGTLHTHAMEKLGESLSTRLKTLDQTKDAPAWSDTTVSGVDAVRRTFLDPQRMGSITPELKKQAATLCGHALLMVRSRVSAGLKADDADASTYRSITNAAEITLLLIQGGKATQNLGPALSTSLETGQPGAFTAMADDWIARLSTPPFSLDAAQFKRK